MRAVAIAVVAIGCGAAGPPPTPVHTRRPNALRCAGLDAEACEDETLVHGVCLRDPDDERCEPLRVQGRLPPPPPPLAEMLGCWTVSEPRLDLPAVWICLGEHDYAIRDARGWDVWRHAGWMRDDSPRYAGWATVVEIDQVLVMTVIGERPYLSDGRGLSAALWRGGAENRVRIEAERAALPTIDEVFDAAQSCLDAIARVPEPPSEIEVEHSAPEPERLAGLSSLRDCDAAWTRASQRLRETGGEVPPSCARTVGNGFWAELERPYAPLDPRAED